MCLYPTDSAYETAFFTSPGPDCHVPRPRAGISAPVLSLNFVSAIFDIISRVQRYGYVWMKEFFEEKVDFNEFGKFWGTEVMYGFMPLLYPFTEP